MASSNGYSTHVLGTIKSITEGLKIIVYNRYSFSEDPNYSKITLYNLEEIYNLVLKSKKYVKLERKGVIEEDEEGEKIDSNHYEYLASNKAIEGFNEIIYLSNSDNSPIGYTDFDETKGLERDIYIFPKQTSKLSTNFEIILVNSLSSLIDGSSNVSKNYVGLEPYEFTSGLLASGSIKKGVYSGYTKQLSEINKDGSFYGIKLDSGLVKQIESGANFIKLNIEKNIEYSPYNVKFSHFSISYYGENLILYAWEDDKFFAQSLTERNRFGNSIIYTKNGKGYYQLPIDDDHNVNNIIYTAGKFIVCESTSINNLTKKTIFNIITRSWVDTSDFEYTNFVIDERNPNNYINQIPESFSYKSAYKYCPEFVNTYITKDDSFNVNIYRKIGNWYLIKKQIKGEQLYIYAGIESTLYATKDEIDNIFVLNDNTILQKYDTIEKVYNSITKEEETKIKQKSYILYRGIGVEFYTPGVLDKLKSVKNTSSIIYINREEKNLYSTCLNLYRTNVYPAELTQLPEIVCSIDGLLFYKDGNYINYL